MVGNYQSKSSGGDGSNLTKVLLVLVILLFFPIIDRWLVIDDLGLRVGAEPFSGLNIAGFRVDDLGGPLVLILVVVEVVVVVVLLGHIG